MAATPVVVLAAGGTTPTHVHALVNSNRIGCYRPFLAAQAVTPIDVSERELLTCSYCWPAGIVWPLPASPSHQPPRSAP